MRFKFYLSLLTCTAIITWQCTENREHLAAETLSASRTIDSTAIVELGNKISSLAQSVLLANVSAAMQRGGPVHAIQFCNNRAMLLSDSLSSISNVKISRISNKFRNPSNSPRTPNDHDVLNSLAKTTPNDTSPLVYREDDGSATFYKSIFIGMPTCLKCHGDLQNDLSQETRQILSELYPKDLATGYHLGDFRGAWKINFPKPELVQINE